MLWLTPLHIQTRDFSGIIKIITRLGTKKSSNKTMKPCIVRCKKFTGISWYITGKAHIPLKIISAKMISIISLFFNFTIFMSYNILFVVVNHQINVNSWHWYIFHRALTLSNDSGSSLLWNLHNITMSKRPKIGFLVIRIKMLLSIKY